MNEWNYHWRKRYKAKCSHFRVRTQIRDGRPEVGTSHFPSHFSFSRGEHSLDEPSLWPVHPPQPWDASLRYLTSVRAIKRYTWKQNVVNTRRSAGEKLPVKCKRIHPEYFLLCSYRQTHHGQTYCGLHIWSRVVKIVNLPPAVHFGVLLSSYVTETRFS